MPSRSACCTMAAHDHQWGSSGGDRANERLLGSREKQVGRVACLADRTIAQEPRPAADADHGDVGGVRQLDRIREIRVVGVADVTAPRVAHHRVGRERRTDALERRHVRRVVGSGLERPTRWDGRPPPYGALRKRGGGGINGMRPAPSCDGLPGARQGARRER